MNKPLIAKKAPTNKQKNKQKQTKNKAAKICMWNSLFFSCDAGAFALKCDCADIWRKTIKWLLNVDVVISWGNNTWTHHLRLIAVITVAKKINILNMFTWFLLGLTRSTHCELITWCQGAFPPGNICLTRMSSLLGAWCSTKWEMLWRSSIFLLRPGTGFDFRVALHFNMTTYKIWLGKNSDEYVWLLK